MVVLVRLVMLCLFPESTLENVMRQEGIQIRLIRVSFNLPLFTAILKLDFCFFYLPELIMDTIFAL